VTGKKTSPRRPTGKTTPKKPSKSQASSSDNAKTAKTTNIRANTSTKARPEAADTDKQPSVSKQGPSQDRWSDIFWKSSAILLFSIIGTFLVLFIGTLSIINTLCFAFGADSAQLKQLRATLSRWLIDCINYITGHNDRMPFPFTPFSQD